MCDKSAKFLLTVEDYEFAYCAKHFQTLDPPPASNETVETLTPGSTFPYMCDSKE